MGIGAEAATTRYPLNPLGVRVRVRAMVRVRVRAMVRLGLGQS